jgi:hypothetical protein
MFVFVIATLLFHLSRLELFSYSSVTCVYLCNPCFFCNWSSSCSVSTYIKRNGLLYYCNYYSVFLYQRPFLHDSSFLAPRSDPFIFKLHTAALSVLCVMFPVQLSFVVNLLNLYLISFKIFL